MYLYDDNVICKSGGVWKVSGIHDGNMILTESNTGIQKTVSDPACEIMRKIITKEEILEVVSRIGFIRTIQAPNDRVRKEFYEEAMAKYDELEWVKVIKTAYLRAQEGRMRPYEEDYSQKAKEFLHGEISVLLDIPFAQVEEYISFSIANDIW